MNDRDIMKLARDALTSGVDVQMGRVVWTEYDSCLIAKAVTALTERLAQPEQEPVAWVCYGAPGKRDIDFEEADINGLPIGTSLYATPPQRKPLTDEQIDELSHTMVKGNKSANWLCRAIEAAHGVKGDR